MFKLEHFLLLSVERGKFSKIEYAMPSLDVRKMIKMYLILERRQQPKPFTIVPAAFRSMCKFEIIDVRSNLQPLKCIHAIIW